MIGYDLASLTDDDFVSYIDPDEDYEDEEDEDDEDWDD